MQVKLGEVEFGVNAVKNRIREAVLGDPIINQVVWRDVYKWDHVAGQGETLVQMAQSGAVPLPNGMVFFVPKSGSGPAIKSESASANMSKRVLKGVGAASVTDILRGLHGILHMPQKILPLEVFEPLNAAASYLLKMHTVFNVVELSNPEKNMAFHVIVPGQVSFYHEITAKDDAGFAALELDAAKMQPTFLIPPHSKPNQAIRALALSKRVEELQSALATKAAAGQKGTPAEQREFQVAVGELRLLAKKSKAA